MFVKRRHGYFRLKRCHALRARLRAEAMRLIRARRRAQEPPLSLPPHLLNARIEAILALYIISN